MLVGKAMIPFDGSTQARGRAASAWRKPQDRALRVARLPDDCVEPVRPSSESGAAGGTVAAGIQITLATVPLSWQSQVSVGHHNQAILATN